MRSSRFFLFSFDAPKYYVGVFIRSLLICLLPVVIGREVSMQIIPMCIILCTFMVLQQAGRPWHSLSNNVFDGAASCTLGLLLVVAGMAGGMQVTNPGNRVVVIGGPEGPSGRAAGGGP